jgi:hypothetical protein
MMQTALEDLVTCGSSENFFIVFWQFPHCLLATLLIRFQGKPACHAKGLRALEMLCFLVPCMQISQGAFPSHASRPDHILSLCGCTTLTQHTQITNIQSVANTSSFIYLRQKVDMPTSKHRRQLTTWQVFR